ncbi:MAG: 50S ribosomal protein L6 [Fimbriimonadales bacterium]|nr:50S ribosomal protein L6 [Fimbriimonadales bacterium]MDW8052222.1 50S ribosomal protein L6 [Armatimonadota bacterium]
MSRVGKKPIPLPPGVQVQIEGNRITVKGPKGELSHELPSVIQVEQVDGTLVVKRTNDERFARAQHGLQRTLIANMVKGVSEGYEKVLELIGVGYRAQMEGKTLVLQVGYSHPVRIEPMPGITLAVDQDPQTRTTLIIVRGIDKQAVGQQAAIIRSVRPPDPYKGKGLRYRGEVIRLKPGKQQAGKGKK